MSDEELQKQCYAVITDVWKALKPRIICVNKSEEYWNDVIVTFEGISNKYAGTETADLATKLSVACVNTLEDSYRKLFGRSRK